MVLKWVGGDVHLLFKKKCHHYPPARQSTPLHTCGRVSGSASASASVSTGRASRVRPHTAQGDTERGREM